MEEETTTSRTMRLVRDEWERQMLRDHERLRPRLDELNNAEAGKVLAVLLGSMIARGIEPRRLLRDLADAIDDDPEFPVDLTALGLSS